MKILKIITLLIAFALMLSFLPACKSEVSEETKINETTVAETTVAAPETTEETFLEEPEEPEAEEEEEILISGNPELIWAFEHDDLDYDLESIAISPDGETLTVGSYLTTYTHQLYDGQLVDAITTHRHSVNDVAFSPDGLVMGVGLSTYGAVLLNVEDGSELRQLHGGYDNYISFSSDGKHVATGNREGNAWIWNIESGEQIAEFEKPDIGNPGYIWQIDYHPSGDFLSVLYWTDEGTVNIWDIEQKQIINSIELNILVGSSHKPFKFSPDGRVMAGYVKEDWDHKIRLWDIDGNIIKDIPFEESINDIGFSPDGSMLAAASLYQETTIWDTSTGELLYTLDQNLEERTDGSHALAFTNDGGHLAVVRNKGPLEMWRLPGAEPFEEPELDIKELPPLPSDVLFDTGSAELKAGADEVLEEFANDLYTALPEAKITFIGHTDSRGDAASNLQLSIDRATAVKDWFEASAQENDFHGWEFLVDGKGDTELKVNDIDAEGTFREEAGRINRRVEIKIEA